MDRPESNTTSTLSAPLARPASGERAPETFREVIAGQPAVFNPQAAGDLRADIQFHVTGQEPGDYVLRIAEGQCTAHEGTVPAPAMTIHTPSEVWVQIARGELAGQAAYMKGLYRVEGDLSLLLRMEALFAGEAGAAVAESLPPPPPPEETVQRGPLKLGGMTWLTLAFVPWIAYWVMGSIPGIGPLVYLGVPLVLGLALLGYRAVCARPTWMEMGTPVYFALAGLVTALNGGLFTTYGDVLSSLALAGLWGGTLFTAMPLTGHYSKWSWPSALWTHPTFVKTNVIITAFWVGTYTLQAVAALLGHLMPEQHLLWLIVRYALLVPAFVFTAWFQKWYPANVVAS